MAGSKLHPETGITLESAMIDLRDIIKPSQQKPISPEIILNVITEHFNVTREDIASTKRNSEIVLPRQVFMYLCREYLSKTYDEIGKYVG